MSNSPDSFYSEHIRVQRGRERERERERERKREKEAECKKLQSEKIE